MTSTEGTGGERAVMGKNDMWVKAYERMMQHAEERAQVKAAIHVGTYVTCGKHRVGRVLSIRQLVMVEMEDGSMKTYPIENLKAL